MAHVPYDPHPPELPAKPAYSWRPVVLGYLLVALVPSVFKLASYTCVATWPWWQVLLPLWVPLGGLLLLIAVGWLLDKLKLPRD